MKNVVIIAGAALVGFALYKRHMDGLSASAPSSGYSGGLAGTSSQLPDGSAAPSLPSLATPPLIGQEGMTRALPVGRDSPDAIIFF